MILKHGLLPIGNVAVKILSINPTMLTILNKIKITIVLLLSFNLYTFSTASANTVFSATQNCVATPSIHKLDNPGAVKLEVGARYPILQGNKPTHPEWYLLRIETANPPIRWVRNDCGNVSSSDIEINTDNNKTCNIANQADSYVFAVSWQPAFCESKPEKPECATTDASAYQASQFSLHGLWPNKESCGIDYGYCGDVKAKPANFCDYPQVNMSSIIRNQLSQVMPSVSSSSCLERHEWHKHGTCQSDLPDQYFEKASNLVHQFNESGISDFMKSHINRKISLDDFRTVLDSSLGSGASTHVKLGCKNGLLVDIYVSLPAEIKPDAKLKDLIFRAPPMPTDKSCQSGFRIDAIGQDFFNKRTIF